jgi:hypothetical protein
VDIQCCEDPQVGEGISLQSWFQRAENRQANGPHVASPDASQNGTSVPDSSASDGERLKDYVLIQTRSQADFGQR